MAKNLEKPNELQENSFNQELKGLEREVKYNHLKDDGKWRERLSVPREMRSVLDKYEVKSNLSDAEFKEYIGYINKYKTFPYLSNLTKITDYQAAIIVKIEDERGDLDINLDNLTSITDKQAELLSKALVLRLNGLTSITDKQAESLSNVRNLELGLTNITDKQAKSLSKVRSSLDLNGLSKITDKQAEIFSRLKGLNLYGLTSITDKQAQLLSNIKYLGVMKNAVTPEQKDILLKKRDYYINIKGRYGYYRRDEVKR